MKATLHKNSATPADWQNVRTLFNRAFTSCFHYSIASVNQDGSPHLTPIGSLLLLDDWRGIYFEKFSSQLPSNFKHDSRVCVLAVNAGKLSWLLALLRGRFATPPAVRLYGTAGSKRPASTEELQRWQQRTQLLRWTRGHQLLWGGMNVVRELHFERAEFVRLGRMLVYP